ncbi:MAG TPA: hypothetical protein VHV47_08285 [Opitutaceae bacterium]|jgi:modulator of FtsH protease|nr:hypothetical protein [Opitutaceae bacterium]
MSDHDFHEWLEAWAPFYTAVAAAAATLTGLLFISLSINRERLLLSADRRRLRLALRSFGDFLFVLGLSLLMLVPKLDPHDLGTAVVVVAALRIVNLVRQWRDPAYRHLRQRTIIQTMTEYTFPLGSCLALCWVGMGMWRGERGVFYIMVFILIELISTASRNAWQLLMTE